MPLAVCRSALRLSCCRLGPAAEQSGRSLSLGKGLRNSNILIFSFLFFHHTRKFFLSISTYMEEMLQQIDFSSFLYGKGDVMSPLSIDD